MAGLETMRLRAALRRPASTPAPWLTFAAGAATGLLVGLVFGWRRPATTTVDEEASSGTEPPVDRRLRRWRDRAWEGAVQGLEQARDLVRPPVPVDLEALRARLDRLPSGTDVQVRQLEDGILEVVGTARDGDEVRALLDAAAAEPGVQVVVNRVWTPSSAVHNLAGPDAEPPIPQR